MSKKAFNVVVQTAVYNETNSICMFIIPRVQDGEAIFLERSTSIPSHFCQPKDLQLHSVQRSDLGTESFTLIRFLTLNEESANFILRLLQYLLTNMRAVRRAKLERGRYSF